MKVQNVATLVVLIFLTGMSSALAGQPKHPDAVAAEEVDEEGTRTTIGYVYTHILDYTGFSSFGSGKAENVRGGMHGLLFARTSPSGKGWLLNASFTTNLSAETEGEGEFGRPSSEYEMERYDVEGVLLFPLDWYPFVSGWNAGIKYARIEKDAEIAMFDYKTSYKQTYVGPMLGAFGQTPLSENSPFSVFWTANLMGLSSEGNFEKDWVFGWNGTAGVSLDVDDRMDLSIGYRIQQLGTDEFSKDEYTGIIVSGRILLP